MAFALHHIHLKAPDPRKTAQWYVDMFGASIVSENAVGGGIFLTMDLSGVTINVSSPREGEQLGPGSADLRFGLEHFGLRTDDVSRDVARLKENGVEILVPTTDLPTGARIAFMKAPDDVRIELVQPAP